MVEVAGGHVGARLSTILSMPIISDASTNDIKFRKSLAALICPCITASTCRRIGWAVCFSAIFISFSGASSRFLIKDSAIFFPRMSTSLSNVWMSDSLQRNLIVSCRSLI